MLFGMHARLFARLPAILILAGLALNSGFAAPPAHAGAPDPMPAGAREAARTLVKLFATQLQGALKRAVEAEGFEHAIGVCNIDASRTARSLGAGSGWRVARTAMRLRNPDNAPTPEEQTVLFDFMARTKAGGDLAKMEHEAVTYENGRKRYRYMKAIPLGEICVSCHGADIDPDLAAAIRTKYPQDRATGFKPGELRGAFILSKALE